MKDKTNTPEEILDLVDESDQVIGEVTKSEANQKPGLLHRESGVLLYTEDGRLLLQQRSLKKQVSPGTWEVSCAGHVTKGLAPLAAAHMELKEELGFDTELRFVEKYKVSLPNETHFTYFYLGKYSGQKIIIEKGEVEEARLFDEKEFDDLVTSDAKHGYHSHLMIKRFWVGEFNKLL